MNVEQVVKTVIRSVEVKETTYTITGLTQDDITYIYKLLGAGSPSIAKRILGHEYNTAELYSEFKAIAGHSSVKVRTTVDE